MVRHRQRLREALRLVVHAAWSGRVHMSPIRFGLRVDLGVSVHLARGGEHVTGVVRVRERERVGCPHAIDLEGLDGMPQVVARARG